MLYRPLGCSIYEENCPLKATIVNKIGPLFTIKVPDNGFLIRNVIFDAIDSVIDCKT